MRYVLVLALIFVVAMAWEKPKCTHVYTVVANDTVAMGGWHLTLQGHGTDIVCVKCFYETKQVAKYPDIKAPGFGPAHAFSDSKLIGQ